MVRALGASVALIVLVGCDLSPAGPFASDGLCVAVINVGGVLYSRASLPSVPPDAVSDAFLHVTRNTGCLDQGQPADPLAPGESNFLDAGTVLHRVVGFRTEERLVHWSPVVAEWLVLMPMP
jgi:hypothetical protein